MKTQKNTDFIKLTGKKSGKTLAIFCGIHGNERAGIMTVDVLVKSLSIDSGIVYLVYANPRAIEKNVRYTETNLNRNFIKGSQPLSYEQKRAESLISILDECDALLDLHAYNQESAESTPFLICESNCFELTQKMDFSIIVTNIDSYEKGGTDGYMFNQGKIGICAELGAINNPEKFVELGLKTAYQFLQYFECIKDNVYSYDSVQQIYISVCGIYKKQTNDFKFMKEYSTFDEVYIGEKIAVEPGFNVSVENDGYILFPSETSPVGIEAFLLAKKISK